MIRILDDEGIDFDRVIVEKKYGLCAYTSEDTLDHADMQTAIAEAYCFFSDQYGLTRRDELRLVSTLAKVKSLPWMVDSYVLNAMMEVDLD